MIGDNKMSNIEEYVVKMRRELHKYPEISGKEFKTAELIRRELDSMGIDFTEVGTSTVAEIKGTSDGITVALRADIDALSVTEETELDFRSENTGVMHACGHDFHTAALLGCVRMISENPDLIKCGTVFFIFQSAEETAQGARQIMASGLLEKVDVIMGMHVTNSIPKGKVNIESGPREAAAGMFSINVEGFSGHGAMPNQTVDAVVIGSQIVNALQTIVSRNVDPLKPAVVSVGTFYAGERFNVIAGKAEMTGTMRAYEPDVCRLVEEKIRRIASSTAEAGNAVAHVECEWLVPPLINDRCYTGQFIEYLESEGKTDLVPMEKIAGAEDFAVYTQKIPGVYAFIGVEDDKHPYPVHHSRFDMDEKLIIKGSELFYKFVEYISQR